MKRSDFLKKIVIGGTAIVVTPTVLKAESTERVRVAIDVNSISHFSYGGKNLFPADILQIWKEQDVLIYNSHFGEPPMVLQGEVSVFDTSKL